MELYNTKPVTVKVYKLGRDTIPPEIGTLPVNYNNLSSIWKCHCNHPPSKHLKIQQGHEMKLICPGEYILVYPDNTIKLADDNALTEGFDKIDE